MNVRLGTRSSRLALAQADHVKELIETKLGWSVEIVTSQSLGDRDLKSKLTHFRGQGVFTSGLEVQLHEDLIDLAVHSLKDLPVEDNKGLQTIAFINRHHPGDSIILKKDCLISENPLKFKTGLRFATGSPRRQSQLLGYDHQVIPVDIRGNVETRLSRLKTSYIDAVIMATAVFERISLELPEDTIRIKLPLDTFPGSPGQGVIAVQVRKGTFAELSQLNDEMTYKASTLERLLLLHAGGGCELSLGLLIQKQDDTWVAYGSKAEDTWKPSTIPELNYISLQTKHFEEIQEKLIKWLNNKSDDIPPSLVGKRVLVSRSEEDSKEYTLPLKRIGAEVYHSPIYHYSTKFSTLMDDGFIKAWKNAEWLIVSSRQSKEFLQFMCSTSPKTFRVGVTGPRTAAILRDLDLPVHLVSNSGIGDLQNLLREAREIHPGEVLYLHGEEYHGLPCDDAHHFDVYTSQDLEFDLPPALDYLVVFSKRAASRIFEKFGKDCTQTWVAIGSTTGQWLKDQGLNVIIAQYPSPKGLITTITTHITP